MEYLTIVKGLHLADIVIILLYLVLCFVIGLYKSRAVLNIREYAIGRGSFNDIVLISTIFATFAGASYTIGTVDKVYGMGLLFALPRLVTPLFWLITLKIFAGNMEKFQGCMTISDIMERLYGAVGRWVTNITALIVTILSSSIQALAIGQILQYFSGISLLNSIFIGMMITAAYSAFGGVRAVAFTDLLQFSIFMIAIPIAFSFLYHDLGGYSKIVDKIPPKHLELDFSSGANLLFFISLIIYGFIPDFGGAFVQRFLMASSKKQLSKALKVIAIINFPFLLILCAVGFLIKVKAPDIQSDTVFVYFIDHYLAPGIKGLLIVALLAVFMSTADSWLNFGSILTAHDIIKRIFPSITDKQELFIARISVIVIAFLSVNIALYAKGLVELDWLASNFWDPFVLIPLIAGVLYLRTNYVSYLSAVVLGLFGVGLFAYIYKELSIVSFLGGVVFSSIGLFGMHYLQYFTGLLGDSNEVTQKNISCVVTEGKVGIRQSETSFRSFCKQALFYVLRPYFILDVMSNQIKRNGVRHYTFSVFVIFHYLIPFFITNIVFVDHDNILIYFRMIAIFLCIGLIFVDYWPKFIKQKFFALYWYSALLFCLPFIATYTFFVTEMEEFWLLNTVLSITLLGLLVDSISFMILTLLGVLFGYFCYMSLGSVAVAKNIPSHNIYLVGYLYAFLMLIIIVFVRGKERAEANKVTQMEIFGGAIAHEVKTPLAAIQMLAETFDIVTSDFRVKAKKTETQNGIRYQCIFDERDFDILFNFLPKNLLHTSKEGQKVVELLLLLLKHKVAQDNKLYSMREVIQSALDDYIVTYSLSSEQLNRIVFDKTNDFYFYGPKQYIKQVFNNLITNSLKYAGENATITIWLEDNALHFKDNGKGIKPEVLAKLFQPFYSGNITGNGIGLAFCEILISNMGGVIECKSEPNLFTEFIIKFSPV